MGGTWTTIGSASVSGTSGSLEVERTPPGAGTYCYRVSVADVAGNAQTNSAA